VRLLFDGLGYAMTMLLTRMNDAKAAFMKAYACGTLRCLVWPMLNPLFLVESRTGNAA
jgi:hypothetical protein